MRLRILVVLSLLALSAVVRADSGGAGPIVASIDSIGITVPADSQICFRFFYLCNEVLDVL